MRYYTWTDEILDHRMDCHISFDSGHQLEWNKVRAEADRFFNLLRYNVQIS